MVNLAEDSSSALLGTATALLALTCASVALRTYVRASLTRNFQVDDWLMLVAQAIFTISCTFIFLGIRAGLGKHNAALSQPDEIEALKFQALATATYILNMMFIKLSYAIFLLRLAVERRYYWTLWVSIVVVALWSTVLFFWDIFECLPVPAQWDHTIPGARCVSTEQVVAAAYSLSVMTIVTDWLYALLPIPMIYHVKMTKQAKATVIVLLGLGIFASVATLVRLKYLSDLNEKSDILFAGTPAMVWTLIEPGVAIIASSLVTIRPLLHAMRVKGFLSPDNSTAPLSATNRAPRTIGGGTPGGPRRARDRDRDTDIRLSDMDPREYPGPPQRPPPPKSERDGGASTSNDSEASLQMPVPAGGAGHSRRDVEGDELPLTRNRG
ncbi:hypothetical protein CONLIGDRAFT_341213 [Coniochaeta ligniaria NRRL 30616]|uniref:Rhodopsin domain-containing protein n=1 Tax=Coniochaeta ligniaria NRRL 30616 TaxID=1408157 RepID=A0A1J7IR84_9PEZI|nr:hypothetical protein CONLIGDRAFT_341213 [Coniochaeta ligniaria NRRL 30616]